MAAPFLLGLLLIAAAGTAGGDAMARDDLPHLELRGIPDSGRAHGSDSNAPPQGLMGIMSWIGCESFAGILAATPRASEVFQERVVAAGAGAGLTVFCPDDKAVAAFEQTFRTLADADRLAVLLHHGVAARYDRALFAAFDWVAVRTLAVVDNKSQSITVRDDGDTVWLWTSRQGGAARVIKTASSEKGPLAVYLVDAMLLPGYLRQKLDGGYFAWLHYCVPLWTVLSLFAAFIVGILSGALLGLGMLWIMEKNRRRRRSSRCLSSVQSFMVRCVSV